MDTKKKTGWLAAGLIAAAVGLAGRAQAGVGSPSYLNIDVTINATKSVSVDSLRTSSDAVSWDGSNPLIVPTSTAAVKNDSGILSESWALSTLGHSEDATNGANGWTIAASSSSLPVDNVAVQAVFGSSSTTAGNCPATGATEWNNSATAPVLTTTPQTYSQTLFADSSLATNGSYQPDTGTTMYAGSQRVLCWRLAMPTSTTLSNEQIVPIIVTAN